MSVLSEFLEFIEHSKPQKVERLLQRVLLKSRRLTGAEAGTVFIVRGQGKRRRLEAADIQNDVVEVAAADFVVPITTTSIAGFTAATGQAVLVDDLYAIPEELPYSFDPSFDRAIGYRSRSMMSFPLTNYSRRVIGVVQLINRRAAAADGPGPDGRGDGPLPFAPHQADLILPFNHIVGSAVERADMLDRISEQNRRLRERNSLLREQRARIEALRFETEEAFQLSIRLLARAAELHDEGTANHVLRVNEYSFFLAKKLGLPQAFCDEIRYSAQLHDVGKMSIDAAILRKCCALTDEERAEMMRHPEYGHRILLTSDRLRMAAEIALNHHERWDGGGYPAGRQGEQIPISARIVAMADIYDALRSPRPYKPGYAHETAYRIMLEGDERIEPASHFDPSLLQVFERHHSGMDAIWSHLAG